jgi:hypothetical protein
MATAIGADLLRRLKNVGKLTPAKTRELSADHNVLMPGVHHIASLLKRWVLGTHQGSVTADHLQSYLEEFTFRFNRRTSRWRGDPMPPPSSTQPVPAIATTPRYRHCRQIPV